MSKENLSKKIEDILNETVSVNPQTILKSSKTKEKEFIHETVDVILKNRIFNTSLHKELDITEESFKKINNSTLREFTESCGHTYTTRKQTIQLLFETGKVSQDVLFLLEEKQREEIQENAIENILESFDNSTEDEFIVKYGKNLDLRSLEEKTVFCPEDPTYEELDGLSDEDWQDYIKILNDNKVNCIYDPSNDCFICNKIKDEQVERFPLEKQDVNLIEKIVKDSKYSLVEAHGFPKSTGKDYVIEIIVEKDGYKSAVEYHDTQLRKPWKIGNAQFQFLQEALSSITVPYKKLIKEQKLVINKPGFLDSIRS